MKQQPHNAQCPPGRSLIAAGIGPKSLQILILVLITNTASAADPVIGFTEPFRTIRVAAAETGILAQLDVRPGDRVSAQQTVGSLDSEVLKANAAIARMRSQSTARLKAAQIRYRRAQESYEKLTQLFDEGHGGKRELQIAQSDLELAVTDVDAVKEEVLLGQLDVKRINAEIQRRQIVSPINGVVTEVDHEVGEFVAMTDPNVLTIVDLSKLKLRFYPLTAAAEQLKPKERVVVRFLHSNRTAIGTVSFVAPVIDADSDTVQIEVTIDNTAGRLRSGRRCILEGFATPRQRQSDSAQAGTYEGTVIQ